MAFRASPPRKVADWTKTAVAAAETVSTTRADYVNLEQSTVTHANGFAHGVYAIFPDKHHYDRLRFSFGSVTLGGTVTAATVAVYAMLSDDSVVLVGESELSSAGTFPAIEAENYQAVYDVVVTAITGTTPTATMDVFVQGVHQGYIQ